MSKVKRGTAGEMIFKAKALLAGFNIFSESNQDSKCDCIIQKDNPLQLHRIQIKLINPQNQLPVRKLTHSKTKHKTHHYTKEDVDYLVGVDLDTFDVYIVPLKFINKFTSVIHINKLQQYKNNFNLQEPYLGNWISADPQVGETSGNGNTELGSIIESSVETLRDLPKFELDEGDLSNIYETALFWYAEYNTAHHLYKDLFKEYLIKAAINYTKSDLFKEKYGKDKVQTTNTDNSGDESRS